MVRGAGVAGVLPLVSDNRVFELPVVAYERFGCIPNTFTDPRKRRKIRRERKVRKFQLSVHQPYKNLFMVPSRACPLVKKAKQRRIAQARIAALPFNTQGLCKLVLGPDPADKTSGASRPLNKLLAGYRSGVDVESTADWSIIQLARKLHSYRDCKGRKREQAAHCESTRNLRRTAPQKCLIAGVPFLFPPLPTAPNIPPFLYSSCTLFDA